jgi:hypothetical protein
MARSRTVVPAATVERAGRRPHPQPTVAWEETAEPAEAQRPDVAVMVVRVEPAAHRSPELTRVPRLLP